MNLHSEKQIYWRSMSLRAFKFLKPHFSFSKRWNPIQLPFPYLSNSAIFLSLSFFSFSTSFKISKRRSTSAWALLDSSLYLAISLSNCCIRSLISGLALASSVASCAYKEKCSNSIRYTYNVVDKPCHKELSTYQ